jgi:hypothetical protein
MLDFEAEPRAVLVNLTLPLRAIRTERRKIMKTEPTPSIEEIRDCLVALVEYHDALVHFFVPDCPITREQVARAHSRHELMALAKVVAQNYDGCRGLAESIVDCAGEQADVGDALDHYVTQVEGLFPCRFCGGHVSCDVCDDCERGDGSQQSVQESVTSSPATSGSPNSVS